MSVRKALPTFSRQFSTTSRRQADVVHPGYKNLKLNQELFQKEDGNPIHVKKGGLDALLYRSTVGSGFIGVAWSFYTYYCLAVGKK